MKRLEKQFFDENCSFEKQEGVAKSKKIRLEPEIEVASNRRNFLKIDNSDFKSS